VLYYKLCKTIVSFWIIVSFLNRSVILCVNKVSLCQEKCSYTKKIYGIKCKKDTIVLHKSQYNTITWYYTWAKNTWFFFCFLYINTIRVSKIKKRLFFWCNFFKKIMLYVKVIVSFLNHCVFFNYCVFFESLCLF